MQPDGSPAKPSDKSIIQIAAALKLDANHSLGLDGYPPIALAADIPPPDIEDVWGNLTLEQKQCFAWFVRLLENPRAKYEPLPTRPDPTVPFVPPAEVGSGTRERI